MIDCAPNKSGNYTCLNKNELIKLSKIYNESTNDKKKYIKISSTKKQIWECLVDRLGKEKCWTELDLTKSMKKNIQNSYKTPKPLSWKKNKYEWLSTTNINNVMNQYEKKYQNFKFLGAVPADCGAVSYCSLAQINPANLYKNQNITKFGIVFNTDTHNKGGAHWVSVLININEKKIIYVDSYGMNCNSHIQKYINNIIKQFKQKNIELNYIYNKKRHQYGGSECGVYSMYFMLELLNNKSLSKINQRVVTDNEMNLLRDYFYRNI
jgi:hypothetical protein